MRREPSVSTTLAMITSQAFSLVNFRGPLIAALVSRGTQVYALAPDYDDDLKQRVAALGAHPVDCSMARAGLNPLRDLGDLWRLSRLLRRLAPDATLAFETPREVWREEADVTRLGLTLDLRREYGSTALFVTHVHAGG